MIRYVYRHIETGEVVASFCAKSYIPLPNNNDYVELYVMDAETYEEEHSGGYIVKGNIKHYIGCDTDGLLEGDICINIPVIDLEKA